MNPFPSTGGTQIYQPSLFTNLLQWFDLVPRVLIYFWYPIGGHLFDTGHLFRTAHIFFFEKQQNVKQSVDVYLNEDKKGWKMDLFSLHPSLLEWLVKQS